MRVYIKAPARLHLGILDLGGDLGRLFGGIGVAIDRPFVVVEAENSPQLTIQGEREEAVTDWIKVLSKKYNVAPTVALKVRSSIPQHVGLGSGTQLALATATAAAKLLGIEASVQELALTLGRGAVSGIGTTLFENGGFVVEAGVRSKKNKPIPSEDNSPQPIFQKPFPDDWHFAVAIPQAKSGLSGEAEAKAFNELPPMSKKQAGDLSHLVLMSLLPALEEKDIETFGSSLTQIQEIVGDCFAGAQGGRFSSSPSSDCVNFMLNHGASGAGQSSWGPTVYGLVQGEEKAKKLASEVEGFLCRSVGGTVFWASANNRGAYIKKTK